MTERKKSEKTPMTPEQEASKYRVFENNVFPLMDIPSQTASKADLEDENKAGPSGARQMSISTLKLTERYYPELKISTVKETINYGNSSVSMGLVKVKVMYLERSNMLQPLMYINIINYGSGGPKFQRYQVKNGRITVHSEHKPRGEIEFNFQNKDIKAKNVNEEVMRIASEETGWNIDKENTLVFATGGLREEFMKNKSRELYDRGKQAFNDLLPWFALNGGETFFKGTDPIQTFGIPFGYYLPQDVEGTLELIGLQEMFRNLREVNELYSPPIASFGIGGASTQFAVERNTLRLDNLDSWPEIFEVLSLPYGMKKLNKLMNDGPEELSQMILRSETFNNAYQHRLDAGQIPIIALKSGALLQEKELVASIMRQRDQKQQSFEQQNQQGFGQPNTPKVTMHDHDRPFDVSIVFVENGVRRQFGAHKDVLSQQFRRLTEFFKTNDVIEFKQGACLTDIIKLILDADDFQKINVASLDIGASLGFMCGAHYLQGDTQRFSHRLNELLDKSQDPLNALLSHHVMLKFLHSQGLHVHLSF